MSTSVKNRKRFKAPKPPNVKGFKVSTKYSEDRRDRVYYFFCLHCGNCITKKRRRYVPVEASEVTCDHSNPVAQELSNIEAFMAVLEYRQKSLVLKSCMNPNTDKSMVVFYRFMEKFMDVVSRLDDDYILDPSSLDLINPEWGLNINNLTYCLSEEVQWPTVKEVVEYYENNLYGGILSGR